MSKLGIICSASQQFGLGHLSRVNIFRQCAEEIFDVNVFVVTDSVQCLIQSRPDLVNDVVFIDNIAQVNDEFDILVFDVAKLTKGELNRFTCPLASFGLHYGLEMYFDLTIDTVATGNFVNSATYHEGRYYLLGAKYAFIKQDFVLNHRKRTKISNVLVIFGGADPAKLSLRLLEYIEKLPESITIVIGPLNSSLEKIEQICYSLPQVKLIVNPTNVAKLMEDNDLLICSPGVTMLEGYSNGLPVIGFFQNETQAIEFGWLQNMYYPEMLCHIDELVAQEFEEYCQGGYSARLKWQIGQGTSEIFESLKRLVN